MVGSKRLRSKTTVTAHSRTAEASLPPRGTAAASDLQQPPIAASMFQQLPGEIQQHPMAARAFQQLPGDLQQPPIAASAFQQRPGQFQQPPMAASAFQKLPREFQQPPMAARSFQQRPGQFQQPPMAASAFQQLPEDFQQPPMAASAFQQLPGGFQQPLVAAHAVQPPPAATQPLQTNAIAIGTQQQLCHVAAEIAAQPHSPVASSVMQPQGLGAGAATHDSAAIRDHLNAISGHSLVLEQIHSLPPLQPHLTYAPVYTSNGTLAHLPLGPIHTFVPDPRSQLLRQINLGQDSGAHDEERRIHEHTGEHFEGSQTRESKTN
ncbi:unnamed protein product [Prunus armeniaca]